MLNDAKRELIGGVMTSDGSESGANPGPGQASRGGEGVNTHHTVLLSLSHYLFLTVSLLLACDNGDRN